MMKKVLKNFGITDVSGYFHVDNVEKELTRCIESLLAQTYKSIEIILVDDG